MLYGCVLATFRSLLFRTLNLMLMTRNGMGESELDSFGTGQSAVAVSCDHSNEPMDSIKGDDCPDHHGENHSFKKNSTPLKSDALRNY